MLPSFALAVGVSLVPQSLLPQYITNFALILDTSFYKS